MPDLPTLFNELVRCEQELWNAVDAELRRQHGLALTKFEPLRVIASTEDCRVGDVAEALVLTTGGASKLIDTLVAAGHCERRSNPRDRRSSIVALTPRGRRTLADAGATFERVLADLLDDLPARELDGLTTAVIHLRQALASAQSAGRSAA